MSSLAVFCMSLCRHIYMPQGWLRRHMCTEYMASWVIFWGTIDNTCPSGSCPLRNVSLLTQESLAGPSGYLVWNHLLSVTYLDFAKFGDVGICNGSPHTCMQCHVAGRVEHSKLRHGINNLFNNITICITISGCVYTNLAPAAAAAASNNQFQFASVQYHPKCTQTHSATKQKRPSLLPQLTSKILELIHHGQLRTVQEYPKTARKI